MHPDRLLPADAEVRAVARRIHEATAGLPLVSPHGHVDARMLLDDEPFADPSSLLVTPDHYVTRLLHAAGGAARPEGDGREVWRQLCGRWDVLRGTPVRYWMEEVLSGVFGIDEPLAPSTADRIYDGIAEQLPASRPRELYRRFGVSVLATTDDPCDDLAAHAALAADPSWDGRVVPTFRPDRHLEAGAAGWAGAVGQLGEAAGVDTGDYPGYVAALEERRRYFSAHGATSADHGHLDVRTDPLEPAEAARIYRSALAGGATAAETDAFRRHMLLEMARMSCDDGLTMSLHPGVLRNHHGPTFRRYGPDGGHDIPVRAEFTAALRPLLERYGTHPGFHLVLFTVDETAWSREIAPLAGFYPSVFAGVPWWYLDAPDAIRRFHAAVTETAGFSRLSGFVDDTRALCSIPARHDMSRRVEAGTLARLVAEHRLGEDEAVDIAVRLASTQPRQVWKL